MTGRTLLSRADLRAAIIRTARREREDSPVQIATRLKCSHVTVRRVLREAGLYVPRGVARERKGGAR